MGEKKKKKKNNNWSYSYLCRFLHMIHFPFIAKIVSAYFNQ